MTLDNETNCNYWEDMMDIHFPQCAIYGATHALFLFSRDIRAEEEARILFPGMPPDVYGDRTVRIHDDNTDSEWV